MYRSPSRRLPYATLPQVPMMMAASDVLYALGTNRAWNDKPYAFAILHSYVQGKQLRGKTNNEIHYKLEGLEVQVPPHYAVPFVEVREYFGLKPSQVFRVVTRANTTATRASPSASRTSLNRASTGVTPRTQRLASTSSTRPETVRPVEDGDEPPPPPYTAEDPDPDSTRILQEQLTVAAANGRSSSDIESGHARTPSISSCTAGGDAPSTLTGDAPRPNDFPATPAARVGNQRSSIEVPSTSGTTATPASSDRAAAGPLSDEERRAREASELDEAMRASRQAEKERLEYEAAIQASLASAEEDTFRRSVQDSYTGSPGAGPSTFAESSNAGLNRSATSYQYRPHGSSVGANVQRSATSARGGGSPLPMPGAFDVDVNKAQPALPPTQPDDSLAEMFGGIDFNAPTLAPTIMSSPPAKGKGRMGEPHEQTELPRFQSNNPFLSAEEREREQAEENAAAALEQQSVETPTMPPALPVRPVGTSAPPALPMRPGAWSGPSSPQQVATALGTSPPLPERSLPPPPSGDLEYDSPHGPPPGWQTQRHESPPGPPPGWQAPAPAPAHSPPHLTLTTPSRNGTMNANDGFAQQPVLTPITEMTPVEERPSRPLPRPTGPPKLVPAPGLVSPMKKTSGGAAHDYYPPVPSPPRSLSNSASSTSDVAPALAPDSGSPYVIPPLDPEHAQGPSPAPVLEEAGENALEMLADYDTVFLIDDSTSMAGERWEQAQKAVKGVVQQAVRYDRNGIDCYFLNSKRVGKDLRAAEDVEDLFAGLSPRGATPTGLRMEAILRDYMSRLERAVASGTPDDVPAMNLIVVTDGAFARPVTRRMKHLHYNPSLDRASLLSLAPTDDPESVLVSIARRLDRGDFSLSQVGVQLLQIGDDSEAREALQELDDGLAAAHNVRDMVDTVPYRGEELTSALIVKVLLGGINRRLDRRG